jgi:DNA-directed RNA polymerase beta' subunit
MLKVRPRDIQSDFNEKALVTSHEAIDNDSRFTQNGVFSEKIFGSLSNGIDYACDCGKYQGAFNLGYKCECCGSKVVFKGLQLAKEGWIDLRHTIIHPVFYRYLKKIIGGTTLQEILNYRVKIHVNGTPIEPPMEAPFKGIGMVRFIENMDDVVDFFINRKKDTAKSKKKDWQFFLANADIAFIDKFPIINSRLRPGSVINGEFQFDEINNLYNALIRNSNTLESMTEIEATDANNLPLIYKNQMLANEVFDTILETLSNKEGFIRNSLIGSRLNLSARNVITPLSGKYSMDDCVMPYKTAIELMKPLIIRKLCKIKRITVHQALKVWFDATLKYNKLVHTIMRDIAKNENVKVLLNRNPTINVGSILLLNIADVKEDVTDVTFSISNLVLPCLAADYDGDVLNIVLIVSKRFVDMFEPFQPSNLVIDCDSGEFNSSFTPFKDIQVGIQSLLN